MHKKILEGEDLLEVFRIRRFKQDKKQRVLQPYVKEGAIVGVVALGVSYMYNSGDKVSSAHCKFIPCNVNWFTCKCVKRVYTFYWK